MEKNEYKEYSDIDSYSFIIKNELDKKILVMEFNLLHMKNQRDFINERYENFMKYNYFCLICKKNLADKLRFFSHYGFTQCNNCDRK